MRLVVFLFLVVLFTSCDQIGFIKNERNIDIDYQYQLKPIENISFNLDSVTSYFFKASEYIKETNCYSFLFNKTLLLYDYESRKLLKKICIEAKNPTSYTFINSDSLLVIDYADNKLLFVDEKGSSYKKININHNIRYYPSPVSKIAPVILRNDSVFFWGNISGEYIDENERNRRVLALCDLKTMDFSYKVPYSEVYKDVNWSGGLFRWVYVDYNYQENIYIVSFPADHNIHLFSSKGEKIKSYYAGSTFIDKIEYTKNSKLIPIEADEKTRRFVENHSYANIIYDCYRDVYYRIAELKTNYKGMMGWQKGISIIIMDRSFNIIGETKIDECNTNYRYAMFVNEKGLHIPQKTSEDILGFKIYKLCEK